MCLASDGKNKKRRYGDPGPPEELINRAAAQWRTQLCLVGGRTNLVTWRDYARFCARVGRKEAAEEVAESERSCVR